jgi:hypothetical protein
VEDVVGDEDAGFAGGSGLADETWSHADHSCSLPPFSLGGGWIDTMIDVDARMMNFELWAETFDERLWRITADDVYTR